MASTRTEFWFICSFLINENSEISKWTKAARLFFPPRVYLMLWLTRVPDRNLWFALLQQMVLNNRWAQDIVGLRGNIPYLSVPLWKRSPSLAVYHPSLFFGSARSMTRAGSLNLGGGEAGERRALTQQRDENEWLMCVWVANFCVWLFAGGQQEVSAGSGFNSVKCFWSHV